MENENDNIINEDQANNKDAKSQVVNESEEITETSSESLIVCDSLVSSEALFSLIILSFSFSITAI